MTFKIEKNIEPPLGGGDKNRKYPFYQMEVGDSFLLNGANVETVRNAAHNFGKAQGRDWKFSFRKTPEGRRCWRVK